MAFKFVIISCLVALVRSGPVVVEPVVVESGVPVAAKLEEFLDPIPNYKFGYEVRDEITGDIKSQHEERSGDLVTGQYSLIDPDNKLRVVTYYDNGNGFTANVRTEPAVNVVEPAVIAEPAPVVTAARIVSAPAPVFAPATRTFNAPLAGYTAFNSPLAGYTAFNGPLAGYTSYPGYQPFARFATFPGTAAQVVAV